MMDSECEDKIYKYKILTTVLTTLIFVLVLFIIINDSYGYYNVEKQDTIRVLKFSLIVVGVIQCR